VGNVPVRNGRAAAVALEDTSTSLSREPELVGGDFDPHGGPAGRRDDLQVAAGSAPDVEAQALAVSEMGQENTGAMRSVVQLHVVPVSDPVVSRRIALISRHRV
jgi:hypothetical protein